MKIKLDTSAKTIVIEELVNLGDLFDMLETLLPDGLWRKFRIESNVINNWQNPIIIKEHPIFPNTPNPIPFQPHNPIQPFPNPYPYPDPMQPTFPWITYVTSTDSKTDFIFQTAPGVFNVEYPKK